MRLQRTIRRVFGRLVVVGLLPLCAIAQLEAQEFQKYDGPDFAAFGPVQLEINQPNGTMAARFVRPTRDGVEIEMLDGDGVIIVAWEHLDEFEINLHVTDELSRSLAHPDPVQRMELLAHVIDPVLPMASLKPGTTNIHILINKYVKTTIEAEDWLAAYETSQKMALDTGHTEIVMNYYIVAVNLFISGERDKALNLLDQLIAARPVQESRPQAIIVAERLLEERLFQPAYRLFRHSAEGVDDLEGKHLLLRCAYLCLELSDFEGAERHLVEAKLIEHEDAQSRGIEQLFYGVKAYLNEELNLALNHLGHALAELDARSSFKQVGLFFNYRAYGEVESQEIAQNILDEMSLLFPTGAYTKLLLSELPEAQPVIEASEEL